MATARSNRATRKTAKAKEKAPTEEASKEESADATPSAASALERLEEASAASGARDPERARAQLSVPGVLDDSSEEADTSQPTGERKKRKYTRRTPGQASASREKRTDAIARANRAEERLAQLEAANSPEYSQQLEELANALAGTLSFTTDMYIGGKPDREGWRWSEAEAKRFGQLWAGPLMPHMPMLGAATPWALAIIGTGKLVMDKARHAREVAAALPPSEKGGGDGSNPEAGTAS